MRKRFHERKKSGETIDCKYMASVGCLRQTASFLKYKAVGDCYFPTACFYSIFRLF
jgi:hypothetical protein